VSTTSLFLMLFAQVFVNEKAKLVANDGQFGDHLGTSVALFQDRIFSGAPDNFPATGFVRSGSVYVFEPFGSTWQQVAQLIPSNGTSKGEFGQSVAFDGLRLIVGAPGATATTVPGSKGLAYVYSKSGSTWVEDAILDPADSVKRFGEAVDIEGDTLIVGAPFEGAGCAYIYTRAGFNWSKQAKLVASSAAPGDTFGSSVLLQGNEAYVGAPQADGTSADSGAVYVFTKSGSSWIQTQKLTASSGHGDDYFGWSLAVDGSTLVIGAIGVDTAPWLDHGGAYIFEWSGQQWQEKHFFVSKGYLEPQRFGHSVAVRSDKLLIGGPDELFTPGFVHIFSYVNSTPLQHVKATSKDGWFVPGVPSYQSGLGWSLSLDGSRVAAGALGATGLSAQTAGAVYVFDIQMQNPAPTIYCSAKQDSFGCVPNFFHSGAPSIAGAQAAQFYTVYCMDVPPKVMSMLFYSTSGPSNAPFAGGVLCLQQPIQATLPIKTLDLGFYPPCSGRFSYDFNSWIASGNDPQLIAGQSVWMQYWYRDPGGLPGTNIGLSDALFVVIGP
jgi:hypothetical protein